MINPHNDVIAAIATPLGEGGISVIRASGNHVLAVVDKNFRGKESLVLVTTHTAHFGLFVDMHEKVIDQVVATVFHGPHSYTGEDTVEISCHGGIYVTQKILEAVLLSGARIASAGEFTQRAFLNGRMDLSQAEAVADLIRSRSEVSHQASISQLQGSLTNKIKELRNRLLDFSSLLETELDFSEEGIGLTDRRRLEVDAESLVSDIQSMIETYEIGRIIRDGVRVALIGRPNVGKSSILNCLLDEDRAIVTHIAGTTRDTIEESITIGGVMFTIVDTAGIRQSSDFVEIEGIRRTEQEILESDLLLLVVDSGCGFVDEDMAIMLRISEICGNTNSIILLLNKIDLGIDTESSFPESLRGIDNFRVSAKYHLGLQDLKGCLLRRAFSGVQKNAFEGGFAITSLRHRAALEHAKKNLEDALRDLRINMSNEFVAANLRIAWTNLGEIVGILTPADVLNNIFSKFCIGK